MFLPTKNIYPELATSLPVPFVQLMRRNHIDDHDSIYLTLDSNRLTHAYHLWFDSERMAKSHLPI